MNQERIMITGSNGFIGSHLAAWVKGHCPDAIVYEAVRKQSAVTGKVFLDFANRQRIEELLVEVQPSIIFHLAGTIAANDWDHFYEGNVKTTVTLLEAVKRKCSQTKVILIGSAAEYGNIEKEELPLAENRPVNPISLYGLSKTCQLQVANYYSQLGVRVITARLFNVYGNGISHRLAIGTFLEQVRKIALAQLPPILHTGNLSAKRDYLYIDDICAGLLCIAKYGNVGEIYNLCSGESVSMQWIVETMLAAANIQVDIVIDEKKFKPVDVPDIFGSYRKLHEISGWKPEVSMEQGIEDIVKKVLGNQ